MDNLTTVHDGLIRDAVEHIVDDPVSVSLLFSMVQMESMTATEVSDMFASVVNSERGMWDIVRAVAHLVTAGYIVFYGDSAISITQHGREAATHLLESFNAV